MAISAPTNPWLAVRITRLVDQEVVGQKEMLSCLCRYPFWIVQTGTIPIVSEWAGISTG